MKNQKKSVIRRAAALLAAVMMLFPAALSAYADEAPSVILPAERLSGTADIIFNSPSGGDMTVTLDGNPLVTEEIGSLELVFAADGVDYNNSVFRIGDTDIAVVDSNGEKRVPLDASLLPGDTKLPSVNRQNGRARHIKDLRHIQHRRHEHFGRSHCTAVRRICASVAACFILSDNGAGGSFGKGKRLFRQQGFGGRRLECRNRAWRNDSECTRMLRRRF